MDETQNQNTETARPSQPQINFLKIVETNAQIDVLLRVLELINFNLAAQMLLATPEDQQKTPSFRVLKEICQLNSNLEEIFNNPPEPLNGSASKIITP